MTDKEVTIDMGVGGVSQLPSLDDDLLASLYRREKEIHAELVRNVQRFPGPRTSKLTIHDLMEDLVRINDQIAAIEDEEDQDTLHVTQVNITEIQEAGANE